MSIPLRRGDPPKYINEDPVGGGGGGGGEVGGGDNVHLVFFQPTVGVINPNDSFDVPRIAPTGTVEIAQFVTRSAIEQVFRFTHSQTARVRVQFDAETREPQGATTNVIAARLVVNGSQILTGRNLAQGTFGDTPHLHTTGVWIVDIAPTDTLAIRFTNTDGTFGQFLGVVIVSMTLVA